MQDTRSERQESGHDGHHTGHGRSGHPSGARRCAGREGQLQELIAALNDDEKPQLTAIAWIGRGAFEAEEFDAAVAPAIAEATTPIDDYLMGMPHLAVYLEAGLEALGVDVKGEEECPL